MRPKNSGPAGFTADPIYAILDPTNDAEKGRFHMKTGITRAILRAVCLVLFILPALGGLVLAESGISGYQHGEIEDIEVEVPTIDIGGIGEYKHGEIEDIEVEVPTIDIGGIGEYKHGEIEDIEVEVPTIDIGGIGEYKHGEIEDVEVEVPTIDIGGIGAYDHGEIENVEVKPVIDIQIGSITYEVPEIKDVSPEIQDFYLDMINSYDHEALAGLVELTPIEAAELAGLQHDLIGDLVAALEMEGIHIEFNHVTGTARLDASLLYATDQYQVTEAGKAVLRDVMRVYCSVLSQDKYRDHIAQVTIVGHTDTDGSYDYNLELSRKRAQAVYDFCLSEECGIEQVDWLSGLLTAEGHSYDELVLNDDGSENKAASRRVEIGFRISVNG